MKSIHVHTTNIITSLPPPRACSFSVASHLLCVFWLEPTAMPQRMWEEVNRPQWSQEQARRLDEGHVEQMRIHDDWMAQERERVWWQQWQDSWAWDSAQNRWTWAEGSGPQWSWSGRRWKWQEPTALRHPMPSSSSWEAEDDPDNVSVEHVHADHGTHRLKAMTPVSFQPQRHIMMILGRPVMVHMWSKNVRAIL